MNVRAFALIAVAGVVAGGGAMTMAHAAPAAPLVVVDQQPPAPFPGQPGQPLPGKPTATATPVPTPTVAPSAWVKDVTTATWQAEVVEASKKRAVVVDYYTTWCGACKIVTPWLMEKANKDGKWILAKVDAEKNREVAGHVRAYPEMEGWINGAKDGRYTENDIEKETLFPWVDALVAKGPKG